eukprot:12907101-Prorocentrum_lima.AAC.1
MGASGYWGTLPIEGKEPPLWPFTSYFWSMIGENSGISCSMLAAALLDEAAATRDAWFYTPS